MIHTAKEIKDEFEDCISCHELGSTGQRDIKIGVINIVSKTHFCEECHYTGYGLPGPNTPEFEGVTAVMMDRNKLSNALINESCTICHKPAAG